jgi:SAM-dependent methyltransferase
LWLGLAGHFLGYNTVYMWAWKLREEILDAMEIISGNRNNYAMFKPGGVITAAVSSPLSQGASALLVMSRKRADELGADVDLQIGDAQALPFPDGVFDAIAATFVFCSVSDPILGLIELLRVTKPGGQLLFMEHIRADNPLLGTLMDALNPMVVRMMGANINRRTPENIREAGLIVDQVEDLKGGGGIFKLINAHRSEF